MEPESSNDNTTSRDPDEEIGGQAKPDEEFHDEPVAEPAPAPAANGETGTRDVAASENAKKGDPLKWNPRPATIVILVILNILAAAGVGYLIYWAVEKERRENTAAPTVATPVPSASPSVSFQPSSVPSISPSRVPSIIPSPAPSTVPSVSPSRAPSIQPSMTPTTPLPTPIFSDAPTAGPFFCDLCGDGKEISITTGEISFGRVTKTCAELQTDAENGDIVEDQCLSLFERVDETCGCRSTETLPERTDASVRALFGTVVGAEINVTSSDEDLAADFILTSDTYFTSTKANATDNELIQRYLLVLTYFKTDINSQLAALSGTAECEWNGVSCEYGLVTAVNFTSFKMKGEFPGDLFSLAKVESIDLSNNAIAGELPTSIGAGSLLQVLDVSSNQLTGALPNELYDLKQLSNLDLSSNKFNGTVSNKITGLTRLKEIRLGINDLTGVLATCTLAVKPTVIEADCMEVGCSCCTSCPDEITV